MGALRCVGIAVLALGAAGCTRPPGPGSTVVVIEEGATGAADVVVAPPPEAASLERVPEGACRAVAERICGEFGLVSPQCRDLVEETSVGTPEVIAGCERAVPDLEALVGLMRRSPETVEAPSGNAGAGRVHPDDDPCAVLAEWFCTTVGPTSEDCVQARHFAGTRGVENAVECRDLLRQATAPVPGGMVAGLPGDDEEEAPLRPCHAVAARTCAELGEANPVCREMQLRLERLQPSDERACRDLLPQIDEVIRVFQTTEGREGVPLP